MFIITTTHALQLDTSHKAKDDLDQADIGFVTTARNLVMYSLEAWNTEAIRGFTGPSASASGVLGVGGAQYRRSHCVTPALMIVVVLRSHKRKAPVKSIRP